jgi:hypothetical protein
METCVSNKKSYNERLFEGKSIRSYLHTSRFLWVKKQIDQYISGDYNMVEIGCFDGRLLEYCTRPPHLYEGFDADWEGGLSLGMEKYKDHPRWKFQFAQEPAALAHLPDNGFQVVTALETIEHIPVGLVEPYLAEMARLSNGYLFITVPNEKGIVFLAKYLYKKIFHGTSERYTSGEVVWATLGRTDKVARGEHKGFDYAVLVDQLKRHFEIVKVEGIPLTALPVSLSFTVGIVARARNA